MLACELASSARCALGTLQGGSTIRLLTVALLFAGFHVAADATLPSHLQENSLASAGDAMDNFNALASEANS